MACAIGGVAGVLVSRSHGGGVSKSWVAASGVLGAVGRLDDVANLPAAPRLGAQLVVGAAVGAVSGGVLGAAVGAVSTPAVVNAFNFMDGINGISGGTSVAWGLLVGCEKSLASSLRAQAFVSAGMGLGFLPHNVPKASMFLGDVGSYLLGAGIAVTIIQSAFDGGQVAPRALGRTLAPLAPYLADTGTTIIKRAVRGESLTVAHREHAYQRLLHASGGPHWAVAAFAAGASALSGLAGRSRFGMAAIVPIVALYLSAPDIVGVLGNKIANDDCARIGGRR